MSTEPNDELVDVYQDRIPADTPLKRLRFIGNQWGSGRNRRSTLSARVTTALDTGLGITTVGDLHAVTDDELDAVEGVGPATQGQLRRAARLADVELATEGEPSVLLRIVGPPAELCTMFARELDVSPSDLMTTVLDDRQELLEDGLREYVAQQLRTQAQSLIDRADQVRRVPVEAAG